MLLENQLTLNSVMNDFFLTNACFGGAATFAFLDDAPLLNTFDTEAIN